MRVSYVFLLLLAVIGPCAASAQSTRALVVGEVRASGGERVAGALAQLRPGRLQALSDSNGVFVFRDVPAGNYLMLVHRIGFAEVRLPVQVGDSGTVRLVVAVEASAIPLSSLIVGPSQFGVRYDDAVRPFEISRADLDVTPQIVADPMRVLATLPAVRSNDFSARFSVRGRPQSEVAVLLDGVELYEPFHVKEFDGSISSVSSESLSSMQLQASGFGARWGGRSGAVLELRSASVGRRPLTVSADLGGGTIALGGDLGDSAGWFGTARYGFLSTLMSLAGNSEEVKPTYGDAVLKASWQPAERLRLGALYFSAFDRNRLDTEEDGRLESRYSNDLVSLRADYASSSSRAESIVSHTWLGSERSAERNGQTSYSIADVRKTGVLTVDNTVSFQLASVFLQTGLTNRWFESNLRYQRSSTDSLNLAMERQQSEHAAFATARLRVRNNLVLEAGVRYDAAGAAHAGAAHAGEARLSPRLATSLDLGTAIVRLAAGRYFQRTRPYELAIADGDTVVGGALRPFALQAGAELPLSKATGLRLEIYRMTAPNGPVRFVNLDGTQQPVGEAKDDRARIDPGKVRGSGAELWVEHEPAAGFRWSAGYALSSSREMVEGSWAPTPDDQPHSLTANVGYTARAWSAAAAWTFHSGRPVTPAIIQASTDAGGRPQIARTFGQYNSERLPVYHRLDLRVSRSFSIATGRTLSLYANIFNAYNRANALAYEYSIMPDFLGQGAQVTRSIESMLPILPSAGLGFVLR